MPVGLTGTKGKYHIATAVHAQLCCKGDTADQKEESIERIRDHYEQGVDDESLIERGQDEVYE